MKIHKTGYDWQYAKIGGITRVKIEKGEDIAHLGELDQKLWTALSCPVKGLEFDAGTLSVLDTDKDGKIKVNEVVSTAEWLCEVVKDKDSLLKGDSEMSLDNFNTETPEGKRLSVAARTILDNLKVEGNTISLSDASDSIAIFKGVRYNGDGVITPDATDNESDASVIKMIMETVGSVPDRSGVDGVNSELIGKFFASCVAFSDWKDKAVLPYGDDSAAASSAITSVKDKVSDFFMRCALIAFDNDCAAAVDVSSEKIGAISDKNLAVCPEEISLCPISRPNKEGKLFFNSINPTWKDAFDVFKTQVLDVDFNGAEYITEADWKAVLEKIAPFDAWIASKAGAEVEGLGIDKVREIMSPVVVEKLNQMIEKDLLYKEASDSIDDVKKFMLLYRDFNRFLQNFVVFSDFYSTDNLQRAMFEAGELYIDQRCCKLCIRVDDMSKHSGMASLSGMFIIYCTCTSKVKGESMNIAAVLTEGGIKGLRPGKNAVFYDRNGLDWDAVVTSVVDNPISIKQAFWSPYRKLSQFISDKIDKKAAEKESQSVSGLLDKVDNVSLDKAAPNPKKEFDIAKFAGIFAAFGMALGCIGTALVALAGGIVATPLWVTLLFVILIMLAISAPSCFIAWRKLRKRDLGPVLNANGWAINSSVLVNVIFGASLTSVAKYPVLNVPDPYVRKAPVWKRILTWLVTVLVVALVALFITDRFDLVGLDIHPKQEMQDALTTTAESVAQSASEAMENQNN